MKMTVRRLVETTARERLLRNRRPGGKASVEIGTRGGLLWWLDGIGEWKGGWAGEGLDLWEGDCLIF
jgi:hypothetical protein